MTVAALVVVAAAAWVLTGRGADAHMRVGILTGDPDMTMGMAGMTAALGVFMATWTTMMVAMMFPAVAPVVLTFRRWVRQRGRPDTTVVAFLAGYLLVWSAIGLGAYAQMTVLQDTVAAGSDLALRVGGGLLVAAGLYQLTPLKDICLRYCRTPFAVIMQHSNRLGRGHRGPFEVGIVHGAYCLGCCWALMVILVLLGMMSIAWMATVSAVIFAEKVLPRGRLIGRAVGVAVMLTGVVLVVAPVALPAL